jgi:hypothetical protein
LLHTFVEERTELPGSVLKWFFDTFEKGNALLLRFLTLVLHAVETVFLLWITLVLSGLLVFCMREAHDLHSAFNGFQAFRLKLTAWLEDMPLWKSAIALAAGIIYFIIVGSGMVNLAQSLPFGF